MALSEVESIAKKKRSEMKQRLEELLSEVEEGKITGLLIIVARHNQESTVYRLMADVGIFQTIGMIEWAKNLVLSDIESKNV